MTPELEEKSANLVHECTPNKIFQEYKKGDEPYKEEILKALADYEIKVDYKPLLLMMKKDCFSSSLSLPFFAAYALGVSNSKAAKEVLPLLESWEKTFQIRMAISGIKAGMEMGEQKCNHKNG